MSEWGGANLITRGGDPGRQNVALDRLLNDYLKFIEMSLSLH